MDDVHCKCNLRVIAWLTASAFLTVTEALCFNDASQYRHCKRVAFVNIDVLVAHHPIWQKVLKRRGYLSAPTLMPWSSGLSTSWEQVHSQPQVKLPPLIPPPIEPPQSLNLPSGSQRCDEMNVVKRTAQRAERLLAILRRDANEQLMAEVENRRSTIKRAVSKYAQAILEAQAGARTHIRVRLLNRLLSDAERAELVKQEAQLDAEYERRIAERRSELERDIKEYQRARQRQIERYFNSLERQLKLAIAQAVTRLKDEDERLYWMPVDELWRALEPQSTSLRDEPSLGSTLHLQFLPNYSDVERKWWALGMGVAEDIEIEVMNRWRSAIRSSVWQFARMYALKHGWDVVVTKPQKGAVDITTRVLRAMNRMDY